MSEKNINAWANALKKIDPPMAESLNENRLLGFQEVEKMDLPRYVRQEIDLTQFLENQEECFKKLDRKKYYITLIPQDNDEERFSRSNIEKENVVDFIKQNIEESKFDRYTLVMQEYFENLFGGNIVVGQESNQVHVEFKKGKQSKIATGEDTPEFFVDQDSKTGTFHYSFEDKSLRELVYNALLSIPHEKNGRNMKFFPGYYEFALVRDDEEKIRPIFFDYKENPAYQMSWGG